MTIDLTTALVQDIVKSLAKGVDREKLMKKYEPKFQAAVEESLNNYIKNIEWDEYFRDGFWDKETYKAVNAMLTRVFNKVK